jgi:hypothetical protein
MNFKKMIISGFMLVVMLLSGVAVGMEQAIGMEQEVKKPSVPQQSTINEGLRKIAVTCRAAQFAYDHCSAMRTQYKDFLNGKGVSSTIRVFNGAKNIFGVLTRCLGDVFAYNLRGGFGSLMSSRSLVIGGAALVSGLATAIFACLWRGFLTNTSTKLKNRKQEAEQKVLPLIAQHVESVDFFSKQDLKRITYNQQLFLSHMKFKSEQFMSWFNGVLRPEVRSAYETLRAAIGKNEGNEDWEFTEIGFNWGEPQIYTGYTKDMTESNYLTFVCPPKQN